MITPEMLAKPNTEEAHQMALMCWVAQQVHANKYPELAWLHHIPNGGARDKITAGKMKAAGVRAGIWDLFLPVRRDTYSGLYIELKQEDRLHHKNGGLSEEQIHFGNFVEWQGFKTNVCYSWLEASAALVWYLSRAK